MTTVSRVRETLKELDKIRKPPAVIYEWDLAHFSGVSRKKVWWTVVWLVLTGQAKSTTKMTQTPLGNIIKPTKLCK